MIAKHMRCLSECSIYLLAPDLCYHFTYVNINLRYDKKKNKKYIAEIITGAGPHGAPAIFIHLNLSGVSDI